MQRFNGVATLSTIEPTRIIAALPDCPQSHCRYLQVTIQHFVFINVYIHQGQLVGSPFYQDKLIFLRCLLKHLRSLTADGFRVILGGDINIMPTDADLYNPDHPEWALNAMVSPTERQLFTDIPNLGFHDIVAERLPHRPYTRWQHYRTASDRQRGFRLDYFFTPVDYLPHISDVQVLTHWRAMPHPSDHAPVKMVLTTTL
jgi:exodeoxyribonuclease-3